MATFLGRKLSPLYKGEIGNRFNTCIEGTRIKHTIGPVSLKMYDKFGLILRIETTVNDVSFFPHYRTVEQRDGRTVTQWARMKKSIYAEVTAISITPSRNPASIIGVKKVLL